MEETIVKITIKECITVLDKILAGYYKSDVDWEAMREAALLVYKYTKQCNIESGSNYDEKPGCEICE
jgi:uncharacterized LabA/DUF88 family protein